MEARVTVFDTSFYPGFDGDDEDLFRLSFGRIMPLRQALTQRWNTDAHMAPYSVPAEDSLPRLNKPSLKWFQSQSMTFSPQLDIVAVDVDMPGHGEVFDWTNMDRWSPPMRTWYARIDAALQSIPELQTAGVYMTRGGLRFVWPLAAHRRIGVALGDSYLRQFVAYLQQKGLPADKSCTQWNRLFRLPFVVRDGQALNLGIDLSSMQDLDWAPPEPLVDEGPSAIGEALRTDMPELEHVQRPPLRDFRRLKASPYFAAIEAGTPLVQPGTGQTHNAMMSTVAFVVSEFDTNDPMVPFRYLMASAEAANYPLGELWNQCVWVCRVHDGGKKLEAKFYEDVLHDSALAMGATASAVRKRLILATRTNNNYYVWNEEDKAWDRPISGSTLLLNKLRACSPTLFRMPSNVPVNQILEAHATVIDHVVVSYMRPKVVYDATMGTVYEPGAPMDPRIRARFNPDIHQWLSIMFEQRLEPCLDWLATLTRLDRPTCALYIKAEPNIGKGVFAQGIARLWGSAPSKYEELIRNFQDGLSQCPLIWADEKVPEDPFKQNDSSIFRKVIGTGRQKIFRKNKPPADLEGFPRILITANNPDALTIRDALDAADILALQQRVGYVETDDSPGVFLRERAHAQNLPVQDFVAPWIEGGGLAGHILWLRDTRNVVPGDRFLVEGWPSNFTSRMSIRFGLAPVVGKFVVKVIRDKLRNIQGVHWGNGKIYVNVDYARDSWPHVMGRSSRPPGDQTLMKALRVLSDGKTKSFRAKPNDNPRIFWSVDVEKIAQIAEEFHLTDPEVIRTAVRSPVNTPDQPQRPDLPTADSNVQGLYNFISSNS